VCLLTLPLLSPKAPQIDDIRGLVISYTLFHFPTSTEPTKTAKIEGKLAEV